MSPDGGHPDDTPSDRDTDGPAARDPSVDDDTGVDGDAADSDAAAGSGRPGTDTTPDPDTADGSTGSHPDTADGSTVSHPDTADGSTVSDDDRPRSWVRTAGGSEPRRRLLVGLLGITAVALALRVVALDGRIFHWDEGRVGYWILRYHDTGVHAYRPIVHGPFLPIVNDWVFTLLPASDFAARLPVAVVGGALPLAAWLFRERLRRTEVLALAALLALNPIAVYYSRFMRNDVLVAAFAVVALGFAVRGFDTGRLRYAFPAAASLGLAFTTKENALLYVLCFLGAGALLADHRLLAARARGESARTVAGRWRAGVTSRLLAHGPTARASLGRVGGVAVGSAALFLGVVFFFYAPRPDLWQALTSPAQLPGVVDAGTVGAAEKFVDTWAGGSHQDHPYLPYLYDLGETLAYGAPAVVGFGVFGIVVDRYGIRGTGPREVVTFATYWAAASLVGYPIATDIQAPWAAVHVIVPLAIPAAVGLAFVVDSASEAVDARDAVSVGLAALVVLSALGGAAAANAAYFNSTDQADKQVLQWAQPSNDLKPTVEVVGEVIADNDEGPDVLFVGSRPPGGDGETFYVRNESSLHTAPPGGPAWHDRLPLPWYLERYDAEITSTDPDEGRDTALSNPPPVVITKDYDRAETAAALSGYTAFEHDFRLWNDRVVVFVETAALERVAPERVPEDNERV